MNPFFQYHSRFNQQASDLDSWSDEGDGLLTGIANQPSKVNNLFMAGLGMGTLFLRMGAVIQMCKKLHDGDTRNDAFFMKQVLDNLRETLPSDTNWKNIWKASEEQGGKWQKAIPAKKDDKTVLDLFVKFRNDFVHHVIRIQPEQSAQLRKGLDVLLEMSALYDLFEGGEVLLRDGRYHWRQDGSDLELHPFVQPGEHEGLPYLFQGLFEGKTKAKFINTLYGDETPPAANAALQERFMPMQQALRGGVGEVFDHKERLLYYQECFVGRDTELRAVMDWVMGGDGSQVLPIFSEAGMGKGALVAGIIRELISEKVPVLYHFCESGMKNSLHAVLYHFILFMLQDDKVLGMNGAGFKKRKNTRLSSRYHDAIQLFQNLLTEEYRPHHEEKPLVVIIDGLDEAAVANGQLKVSDWFKIYNEKGEPVKDWTSPPHVKWIFTHRWMGGKPGGFRLGGPFEQASLPCVQPLKGLTGEAVREALKRFDVSEEFLAAVIEKGKVFPGITQA